jgi:RNA polymerase sigma factor (sigma-70 family)
MNIKLIRKVVFAVLQTEPLYDEELRYFYKMMITQFCRAVEKFDYTTDYTFGTYSAWWIFQASSRARSKIIQKRLDDEWGFTVGLQIIDEKARDLKISLDRYPSYDEIYKELEPIVKEKINKSLEKKELMEEKHFHNIGLNKLFTEIVGSEIIIEPSYDDRLRLNSAIEYLEAREADIINKRFGLHDEKFEYGLTLDEIGLDYKLTRERIRQIINDAIEKIRYYFKDEDLENDKLPFVFFPRNVIKFLKINKIEYFSDISKITIEDFRQMENSSKKVVDALIRTLESLGIKLEATKEGEIKFYELSVRAQNALKKQNLIYEDDLIHLSEQDLNFIPNIGEKTIKELIAYQKRLKGNNKKEFSPEKVILFPCANPVSQRNFSRTMDKQNSVESIKSYLLVNQYNDLKNIGDEFFFWGTKSGEKKWSEIPHKSLALFFANKFAFSYGFVEYKLINQPLSDYFWGRNEESDSSYKYMFACSEVKETSIPQHIVNETLGYKEKFVVQGFMVLNIKQSLDLLNLVNKYKFD